MAGVSTKEIKNRIRSMESTKQITKAMEMVAASKLRRAQAQVMSSRPYFEILYSTIKDIVNANPDTSLPYFNANKTDKEAFIVIAGDRGLAGGYNSNILKLVMSQIQDKNVEILPIGKKAVDYFQSHKVPVLTLNYASCEDVSLGDCFTMAKSLCKQFLAGEYAKIHIAYTNFVSVLSQTPASMQLLPLVQSDKEHTGKTVDIIYEPGSVEVLQTIVPEYLGGILYGALCECRASEQAARRTAMDSATQNADEMIAELSLKFNRARQAAITQEITEIVAGS